MSGRSALSGILSQIDISRLKLEAARIPSGKLDLDLDSAMFYFLAFNSGNAFTL